MVQAIPSAEQLLPVTHCPLLHFSEQHWVSAVHDCPLGVQPAAPQTAPLQILLQQLDAEVHALPSSVQVGPPLLLEVAAPLALEVLVLEALVLEALVLDVLPPPLPELVIVTVGWSVLPPHPPPTANAAPRSAAISINGSGRRSEDVRMRFSGARRAGSEQGMGMRDCSSIRNSRAKRTYCGGAPGRRARACLAPSPPARRRSSTT